jgi:hypothetical protein
VRSTPLDRHSTGTHGMDFACKCERAVRLVRAVWDFDSCAADELHVVPLEPHSRSTKASRDAGLVFLNTNLTRKGCTCDTAAAVRCPNGPLAAHMHPACAAARAYS